MQVGSPPNESHAMRRIFLVVLAASLLLGVVACAPASVTSSAVSSKQAQQYQPWEKDPGAGLFVGSAKSNKYHYPSCEWAKRIKPRNEVWFSSAEAAQAQGYVPCRVCKPPK